VKTTWYKIACVLFVALLLTAIGTIQSDDRSNVSVIEKYRLSDSVLPVNAIYVGSLAIVNETQEVGSESLAEEKISQKESVREITVSGSSLEACEKAMAEVINSNKKVIEVVECKKQELELSAVNNFSADT